MFIYLTSALFITSFILIGGYFYLNYMFNKKEEIKIKELQKNKPERERRYMKPKVFFNKKEEINSSVIFYEFMANLDWENIKLPKYKDNETVKNIIHLFSLRVIEITDTITSTIDIINTPEINKNYDLIFTTNFNKINEENYNENEINLRIEKEIEIYKYEIKRNKLDFFSDEEDFYNKIIIPGKKKVEERIKNELKTKNKKEIFIIPFNLFYTIIYSPELSIIENKKLLTTIYIEDIVSSLKINRVYELIGLIIFKDSNVEIIGIKINNIFYFRNLINNSESIYKKVDFEKEIEQIINNNTSNIISVYGRRESVLRN